VHFAGNTVTVPGFAPCIRPRVRRVRASSPPPWRKGWLVVLLEVFASTRAFARPALVGQASACQSERSSDVLTPHLHSVFASLRGSQRLCVSAGNLPPATSPDNPSVSAPTENRSACSRNPTPTRPRPQNDPATHPQNAFSALVSASLRLCGETHPSNPRYSLFARPHCKLW
jgi:hypothetical protein